MATRYRVLRWLGRWVLRLLIGAAAVAGCAYVGGRWYLPSVVEGALREQFPEAAVSVQGARFSGLGVLVRGVAVAEESSLLAVSPIFFAERVRVGFAPMELLRRRVTVRSAVVRDMVLTVEHEQERGWNVQRLGTVASHASLERVPGVQIERGAVRVRRMLGERVESIVTVGLDGRVGPSGQAGAYAFSFQADDRLGLSGSWAEGTFRIGQAGRRHRLQMTGQLRMPRTQVFDNAWNLDDVVLDCAFDAEAIEVHRLAFRMGQGGGSVSGRFSLGLDGDFDVSADLAGLVISDTPVADAVVYGDSVMALLGRWLEGFLRRYRPRGLGDAALHLRGRWDDLAAVEVFGQVVCRDITVVDATFPYEFEEMAGVIEFSGRSLRLNQLACRHGDGAFVIEGQVADFGPEMEIGLRMTSEKVRFDEAVYRALGPDGKRLWFAFMPSGTGEIDYTYRRFPDKQRMRRLAVDLIDAGVIYEHFPYPLERLTGRVVFEPNRTSLSNVAAVYPDGRAVAIDGVVSGADDFSIRVRAERIPLDATLTEALPVSHQRYLESIDLEGTITADVEVFSDTTGQRAFDYRADFDVSGSRLEYAAFAVPLEEVRIAGQARPEGVRLRQLTGRRGAGHVSLSGQITAAGLDPNEPGVCLDVRAEAFALDEAFWAAAERHLSSRSTVIRPVGPVEVSGRWSQNVPADVCVPMDMTVVCRSTPIEIDGQVAGQVSGLLRLEAGRVRVEDFHLAPVALTESLGAVMPERMRQAYEQMGLTGRIGAAIAKGVIVLDEGRFGRFESQGQLLLDGVTSRTTDFVEDVSGVIDGHICLDAEGPVEVVATYQIDPFRLRNRLIDGLSGRLVYDPNEGTLASRDFSIVVGQGTATGLLTVNLQDGPSFLVYTLDLGFDGIDVDRLAVTDQAPMGGESAVYRGQAEGALSLRGVVGQPETKQGRLTATVSDMQLGKQTLIGNMLTAIQFREPKAYAFDRMELEAFVGGNEVVLDRIRIVGRPFVFHGDGRMDMATSRVEVDLVALGALAGAEPMILDSLLRGLGSVFWKIEIRGSLNEPDIRTISLPILQLPLDLLRR